MKLVKGCFSSTLTGAECRPPGKISIRWETVSFQSSSQPPVQPRERLLLHRRVELVRTIVKQAFEPLRHAGPRVDFRHLVEGGVDAVHGEEAVLGAIDHHEAA